MALTTQIRDLLRDNIQNSLPHHRADPVLENSFEILNPDLHRGHNAFISLHSVGWFKRLFKTDGVGTPSDQPALLHSNKLTGKNPRPFFGVVAVEMWSDLRHDADTHRIQSGNNVRRISLGVVAEASSGDKYFATLDRLYIDDQVKLVAVDGCGDDNWWMEAKSKAWDDLLAAKE